MGKGQIPEKYWSDELKSGLIHLWEFNGNANDKIGTWSLQTQHAGATVVYENGLLKKAIRFNGTGGLSGTCNTSALNPWSFSFWIKWSGGDTTACILGDGTSGTYRGLYCMNDATHGDYINIFPTTGMTINPLTGYTGGSWKHVVVRQRSPYGIESYVSGSKYADITAAQSVNFALSATSLRFGAKSASSCRFGGSIEQFAMWDRRITDNEIAELYNLGKGLKYDNVSLFA